MEESTDGKCVRRGVGFLMKAAMEFWIFYVDVRV